jgi:uncharacterized protein YggE
MNTEDRLAKLEARVAVVEDAIAKAEAMFKTFAEGPGRKILSMFGAQLP